MQKNQKIKAFKGESFGPDPACATSLFCLINISFEKEAEKLFRAARPPFAVERPVERKLS